MNYDPSGRLKGFRTWRHGCDIASVAAFNADPTNKALAPHLLSALDWTKHLRLKSSYNSEIVGLIVEYVMYALVNDPGPSGGKYAVTMVEVRKRVSALLTKIKTAEAILVRREAALSSNNVAVLAALNNKATQAQIDARRYARRSTVRKNYYYVDSSFIVFLQQNSKRRIFCDKFTSGKTRTDLSFTLNALKVNGMSGNESDGIDDGVRRYKLIWLAQELAAYWDTVTPFMQIIDSLRLRPAQIRGQGNVSRPVHEGTVICDRAPINGLPINWYNPEWYENLTAARRQALNAAEFRDFPVYVSTYFYTLASRC